MAITYSRCCGVRVFLALGHVMLILVTCFIPWVDTDEALYTLFQICFDNSTIPNENNYSVSEDLCASLESGDADIPWYYRALQAFVIILCILCFLQLNVCCDNQSLDQGKRPAIMAAICIFVAGAILGIAFNTIVQDGGDYFQGENLQVSLAPYLIIASLILSIFLLFGNLNYDNHRVQEAAARKAAKSRTNQSSQGTGGNKTREPPRQNVYLKGQEKASSSHKNSVAPAPPTDSGPTVVPQRRPSFENHRPRALERDRYGGSERSATPDSDVTSDTSSGDSALVIGASFADHSQMHHLDNVAKEELYLEDLRSASRASVLHNRKMRGEGVEDSHGELPLLDNMPTYTLPPSGGSQTPSRPPPSYESAMRGDYMDMPAPPVVAVPLSYFQDTQTELNPNI